MMRQESRLLFSAVQTLGEGRPTFPYEQVDLPRSDGARQFAWVMRQGSTDEGPWVVYLHGYPSTIASNVNLSHYRLLRSIGFNVLAPEYRGFGGLEGVASEESLEADARAAYDYLRDTRKIPPHAIVLYGWSLGSAIAVHMAASLPPAAMILEGAPASLVDLTAQRYPFFPIRMLMRSRFESLGRIERIPSPMLFLHSVNDEVIPVAEGRRLYAAATGAKMFVGVPGSHVTAIDAGAIEIERAIRAFLARHGTAGIRPPGIVAAQ